MKTTEIIMNTTNTMLHYKFKFRAEIIYLLPIVLLLASCQDNAAKNELPRKNEDGHADAANTRLDTTIWTDRYEIFLDYPLLVVDETSELAAHFTLLEGHQAIENAELRLELRNDETEIASDTVRPETPGIFLPAIQVKKAGVYELIFKLSLQESTEEIPAGQVQVFSTRAEAEQAFALRREIDPEISFSKEQAWQIDFQTVRVDTGEIYDTRELVGRWMTAPGTERSLNAATSGNVMYELPGMVEGMKVHKGQVLMRISGEDMNVKNIATEANKAKARLDQAKSEYDRKSELRELKIIPEAEFEQVRKRYEVAKANYRQLIKNYDSRGVAVRAPISGYIKRIAVEHGGFATAGQALLTIGSQISSMIKALAAPESRETVSQSSKVWIGEDGKMKPVKARVVSVAKKVSAQDPLLPVFIEVSDPVDALEGSLAEMQLGHSNGEKALVVPRSALLEDFGSYKVAVQTAGEAFELRSVRLGAFQGDRVAVLHGLSPGEWVVSRGAYQVKMASMAGAAPAHGHTH